MKEQRVAADSRIEKGKFEWYVMRITGCLERRWFALQLLELRHYSLKNGQRFESEVCKRSFSDD
jgi:hypothetical protein